MPNIYDLDKPYINSSNLTVGPGQMFSTEGQMKIKLVARRIKRLADHNAPKVNQLTEYENDLIDRLKTLRYAYYKIEKAHKHGLHNAAAKSERNLENHIAQVDYAMSGAKQEARNRTNARDSGVATESELRRALAQICEQYNGFTFRESRLIVVTDYITCQCLEHRQHTHKFDPFVIRFDVREIGKQSSRVGTITSLNGNYVNGYIHPHVQDNTPCLGTALPGVKAALYRGDYLTAFRETVTMLKSYNLESPYLKLAHWSGEDEWEPSARECYQCSYEMEEGSEYTIGDDVYCEECTRYCETTQHVCLEDDARFSAVGGWYVDSEHESTMLITENETDHEDYWCDLLDIPDGWRDSDDPPPEEEDDEEEDDELTGPLVNQRTGASLTPTPF